MIGRRLFTAWLVAATLLALVFLMLPLVAIFLRVPPGDLIAQLGSDVAIDAIVVTLKTTLIAQALILVVGTPAAYLIALRRFRGRAFAITLVELPLVLPPAVAGIALLAAFGRLGLLGSSIEAAGISVSLGTPTAVVLAIAYVASPFYVRQAIASFEALDSALLDASRTLGAGPARTFFRIALPLAAKRARGRSGALVRPRHRRVRGDDHVRRQPPGRDADALARDLCAVRPPLRRRRSRSAACSSSSAASILFLVKLIPGWTRSTSTSLSPFARFGSS